MHVMGAKRCGARQRCATFRRRLINAGADHSAVVAVSRWPAGWFLVAALKTLWDLTFEKRTAARCLARNLKRAAMPHWCASRTRPGSVYHFRESRCSRHDYFLSRDDLLCGLMRKRERTSPRF